jgi:Ca-activated chloride channel family protein
MLGAGMAEAAYLVHQNGTLPMVTQKVKVDINNQVAVTRLEMVFYNPNDYTIQPNIRFPIHEKASVQQFSLTDGEGNTYSGTIEESNKATQVFNEAKAEGMMPAMAVQKQPGVFEASIGAVGPKSRASVIIEYSEILPYSRGNVSYILPFNVKQYQQPNLETSAISITLTDQKEISSVVSLSHDIYAEKTENGAWNVVFEKNNYLPAGDFRLNYDVKAEALAANFLSTRPEVDKDGYFMLMLSPAEIISAEDIAMRDIVFVVDTSGSMSGRKMEQTKRAFDFFVKRLNENDRFGIVAFSSQVKTWVPELLPVNDENRKVAGSFIEMLYASGGTNIHGSLQAALKLFDNSEGRTRTLVFLTDGEASTGITDTNTIVRDFNAANTAQVRTFTLGVGSSVNTVLLNKIAVENRGEALYLKEHSQNIDTELMAFYESISTPLLVDLALDWGEAEVSEVFPKTLPNIYQGTQLVITGRYKKGAAANITLNGSLNTVKHSFPVTATFAEESNDNLFVSRFWAKAKADDLMLQMQTYGQKPELKDEVIALSKKYQFATPFTSFVAVSTTPVPQVTQQAAARINNRNSPSSARNTSAMARPKQPSGTAPTRTIVRRSEAKSISLWGATGFLPLGALAVPNFRKARQQSRQKACLANQRVLMGAIEMYNMDHDVMITEMNDHVIDDLVQGKYLKSPIVPAEQSCCFGSTGPLDGDGVIICAEHGTVEDPFDVNTDQKIKDEIRKYRFYDLGTGNQTSENVEIRYEGDSWFIRIWNSWLADVVNLLINVPLFIIGLVFSLYLMYAILSVPFKIIGGIIQLFSGKES